jgi:hypothetical protein
MLTKSVQVKGFIVHAIGEVFGFIAGAIVFFAPEELVSWVLILLTGARLPQLVRSWFNRKSSKPSAVLERNIAKHAAAAEAVATA